MGLPRRATGPSAILMERTRVNPYIGRAFHCALVCAAVCTLSGTSNPSSRFKEIGHQLMCTCGCGQILLECNHVGCSSSDGMRNELAAALGRVDSDSLVQQAFVQKYGPSVLAAPTTTKFDRTAWIIPFALLVLGFTLVIHVVRVWKNRPAPAIADDLYAVDCVGIDGYREQGRKETET